MVLLYAMAASVCVRELAWSLSADTRKLTDPLVENCRQGVTDRRCDEGLQESPSMQCWTVLGSSMRTYYVFVLIGTISIFYIFVSRANNFSMNLD